MRENDFLWSRDPAKSVMNTASGDVRAAIAAENLAVSLGTIRAFPGAVLMAAIGNITRTFLSPGITEFGLVPSDDISPISMLDWMLERYHQSRIANGTMPLVTISLVLRLVYFAALAGALLLLLRARQARELFTFVLLLFLGLVANAIVSGAISGVFDRYQGRVAWLAAFALAALVTSSRAVKAE